MIPDRHAEYTEENTIAYIRALKQAENEGERAPYVIGPYTAMIMVIGFRTLLRLDGLTPSQRETYRMMIEQFKPWFENTYGINLFGNGE